MSAFERVLEAARASSPRVILPESGDIRVLAAASRARDTGIARPMLLGQAQTVHALASEQGLELEGIDIVDPSEPRRMERYIGSLVARQADRGMSTERAGNKLADPIAFACMMVSEGDADACVAGAVTPTAEVVRNAVRYVGPQSADTLVSSCFIMLLPPDRPVRDILFVADCALVIEPDAEQLARIAITTGESARQLIGLQPEVAMLSFSTQGSARHATVSRVAQATALAREQRPDWRIIGEVQLDAAVMPDVLAHKAPSLATDSPCNVLIFPSLDAGNIGYKLIERFGGAKAIGPILQGLSRPVNDLSRGCSTEDIVNIIAVSAAQVAAEH